MMAIIYTNFSTHNSKGLHLSDTSFKQWFHTHPPIIHALLVLCRVTGIRLPMNHIFWSQEKVPTFTSSVHLKLCLINSIMWRGSPYEPSSWTRTQAFILVFYFDHCCTAPSGDSHCCHLLEMFPLTPRSLFPFLFQTGKDQISSNVFYFCNCLSPSAHCWIYFSRYIC